VRSYVPQRISLVASCLGYRVGYSVVRPSRPVCAINLRTAPEGLAVREVFGLLGCADVVVIEPNRR
jgi:hypothetical protein